MRKQGCTLFRGAHDSDSGALKLQAWAHLYKAFTDIGATPEEFLQYLEKNGLAKGDGCGEAVAALLESMLQMTGEKRAGRLPNGRYLAVYFIAKPNNTALVITAREMTEREKRTYGTKR